MPVLSLYNLFLFLGALSRNLPVHGRVFFVKGCVHEHIFDDAEVVHLAHRIFWVVNVNLSRTVMQAESVMPALLHPTALAKDRPELEVGAHLVNLQLR